MKHIGLYLGNFELATFQLGKPKLKVGNYRNCDLHLGFSGKLKFRLEFELLASEWKVHFQSFGSLKNETKIALLSDCPMKMGPLTLVDLSDSFQNPQEIDGMILRQVDDEFLQEPLAPPRVKGGSVELILCNRKSRKFLRYQYLSSEGFTKSRFREVPEYKIEWNSPREVILTANAKASSESKFFDLVSKKDYPMENKASMTFRPDQIGLLVSENKAIFMRFVSDKVFSVSHQIPLFSLVSMAAVMFLLWFFMPTFHSVGNARKKHSHFTRSVAAVEVRVDPAAQQPITEKMPETIRPSAGGESAYKRRALKAGKEIEGINSPREASGKNVVGGLSARNKASGQTIDADKIINHGIVTKSVSGDTGRFGFEKSSSGELSKKKADKLKEKKALDSAATKVKAASRFNRKSASEIVSGFGQKRFVAGGFEKPEVSRAKSGGKNLKVSVSGGLSYDQVVENIQDTRIEIRKCYETALVSNSSLEGDMQYRWVILPDGHVRSVKLIGNGIKFPRLDQCIQAKIEETKFPVSKNGESTTVEYVFKLAKI